MYWSRRKSAASKAAVIRPSLSSRAKRDLSLAKDHVQSRDLLFCVASTNKTLHIFHLDHDWELRQAAVWQEQQVPPRTQ